MQPKYFTFDYKKGQDMLLIRFLSGLNTVLIENSGWSGGRN
jgi:hypothetical protein